MATYKLETSLSKSELSLRAVEVIKENILSTLALRERCYIALSGGSTPSKAYAL